MYNTNILDVIFGIFAVVWVVMLLAIALYTACQWKMFAKAGKPGWYSIVPFLNTYKMAEITFGNGYGYLGLLSLAMIVVGAVPVIGQIASLAIYLFVEFYMPYMYAQRFGASGALAIISLFMPWIAYPIMAFSTKYNYIGSMDWAPMNLPKINLSGMNT